MIFFEDEEYKHFYPLVLTRPVDDLRVGIFKIHEKWLRHLEEKKFSRTIRPLLKNIFGTPEPKPQKDYLWINARFLPDEKVINKIKGLKQGEGLSFSGVPVIVRLSHDMTIKRLDEVHPDFSDILCEPLSAGFLLSRIWELFQHNGKEIEKDFQLLEHARSSKKDSTTNSVLVNPEDIYMGDHVQLDAGAIVDASEGPVYLGDHARLMSGSIVKGPAAICNGSIVKMGGRIYPGTTIGPVCKVGGEVNNVIFQSYSNKAHEGYLGNSYIGEWCNIGADTNSSNLKNNYKPVYLTNWTTGESYNTGVDYCGTIMGDHCKTGINAMLSTGMVCGAACNIFGSRFTPRVIPSFSWVSDEGTDTHRFDKAIETASRMMARRNVTLSDDYRIMMSAIYNNR